MAHYEYVSNYENNWHFVDMRNDTQTVDITDLHDFLNNHTRDGRFLYTSKNTPGGGCTFFVYCEHPDTAFALKMKFG